MIAMCGGGTGGHLVIIKAVKEQIENTPLIYIGSTKGQDRKWFEKDSDFKKSYFLETRGVVNQGFLGKIKSLYMLFKATLKAKEILKENGVKVVFSVGGFSSAPTAFASKLLNIPLVIHEQNAHIGSLNRLLKPYAKYFISSYEKDSPIKDYPVSEEFFKKARVREKLETIIFLGGSQGAVAINNLALAIAKDLNKRKIKIIHQAGERNIKEVEKRYKELGVEAEVFGFTNKMSDYITKADFAIARAGASTLWELTANLTPTLFIPYPYAAGDHQYYNAKFLKDNGVAWVIREKDLKSDEVLDIIDSVDVEKISQKIKELELIRPNGAKRIARLLEDLTK